VRAVSTVSAGATIAAPAATTAIAAIAAIARLDIRLAATAKSTSTAVAAVLASLPVTADAAVARTPTITTAAVDGELADDCFAMDQHILGITAGSAACAGSPGIPLRTLATVATAASRAWGGVAPGRALRIRARAAVLGLRQIADRRSCRADRSVVAVSAMAAEIAHERSPLDLILI
jgi:hypothetical protein